LTLDGTSRDPVHASVMRRLRNAWNRVDASYPQTIRPGLIYVI